MIKRTAMILLTFVLGVAADKPNIVFIYADDLGWTGTSVEMIKGDASTKSDFYQTPNLEKLAAHGMVFSQAYSPGPMCTPSRAAVLTGKTPAETHITTPGGGKADTTRKLITPKSANQLPVDLPTLGTMLKAEGYATALLGKWHIGRRGDAGDYGFDLHDGHTDNEDLGTDNNPKEIFSLTQRGIAFMEENAKAKKPFYLMISHYAVHAEFQSRPESIEAFEQKDAGNVHASALYAGMTWDLDESLAQIFQTVDKLGIGDNTYIVFMSDNGATGNRRKPNNTPLSMGKGSLYEGGIRVPFIISGPGLKSGYCNEPVSGTDLFPTLASWAGSKLKSDEGDDLTPLLTGKEFDRRNDLLFHYPHYGQGIQVPQSALISNHWKLLKDWDAGTTQLFNLESDIGEKTNLAKKEPAQYKQMVAALEQRLKETGAQLPTENPDYDPDSTTERRRRKNR